MGGEVKNVAALIAVGVGQEGYREALGVAKGTKEAPLLSKSMSTFTV